MRAAGWAYMPTHCIDKIVQALDFEIGCNFGQKVVCTGGLQNRDNHINYGLCFRRR
jgi:hypothetical protein